MEKGLSIGGPQMCASMLSLTQRGSGGDNKGPAGSNADDGEQREIKPREKEKREEGVGLCI